MKYIKGIRIKNYRLLRDISFGSVFAPPQSMNEADKPFGPGAPLSPLTVVIGRNGFGKSTLCDALGFIVDCLRSDAERACIVRGGFDKIVSADSDRILEFQIRYGEIQYSLCIAADEYNIPYVYAETLSHISQSFNSQGTMNFFAKNGQGKVVRPDSQSVSDIHLADNRRLVLSTLGNMTQYPDIVNFRRFLDRWYLCFFKPDAARQTPLAGPHKHLSERGDNLANVVQFWERNYPERLNSMVSRVLRKVLGINRIDTKTTEDGRLLLRFHEQDSKNPFYASQMSDGTLKLVAYMILLGDPDPPPFVCFEEPENGLYHKLLATFIDEIRLHNDLSGQDHQYDSSAHPRQDLPDPNEAETNAEKKQTRIVPGNSQFLITTHQPYLVDALQPDEVWILERGENNYARIRRASEDPVVRNMVEEGMPLGALWFSEYLDG